MMELRLFVIGLGVLPCLPFDIIGVNWQLVPMLVCSKMVEEGEWIAVSSFA